MKTDSGEGDYSLKLEDTPSLDDKHSFIDRKKNTETSLEILYPCHSAQMQTPTYNEKKLLEPIVNNVKNPDVLVDIEIDLDDSEARKDLLFHLHRLSKNPEQYMEPNERFRQLCESADIEVMGSVLGIPEGTEIRVDKGKNGNVLGYYFINETLKQHAYIEVLLKPVR